jgi:subfamily B ATP-binding cassette protein MsbA
MLEGLRQEVFAKLQELSLAFYQRHKSGDLVTRLINDTGHLRAVMVDLSSDIIKQPFTLLFAIGFLIYESVKRENALFAIIALLSVPACIIPIRLVARRLAKKSRQVALRNGELAALVTESVQSPVEIQAYNLQEQQKQRFATRVREILKLSLKTIRYRSLTGPLIEFISVCGFMAALYFATRSGMDRGTFTALGLALYFCYDPVKKLSTLNEQLRSRVGSLERLEYLLNLQDTVPNPMTPERVPAFPAEIRFDDVSFVYPGGEDVLPALSEITVRIRPGETVALVGASGAGKSTFVSLIPRFYDPTGGRVSLGGVDLRELDKNALRDRIALVPQLPALFDGTVAENIRIGKLAATDAEVREAARHAYVAEFVEALPEGYDTLVGERGASLSVGQRQRIAIARAFLKDAPILILDEATSALDSESEAMVKKALRELMQGRTTVMIAHRFSSISLARRVLVFEEGRITGDGAPEVLGGTHPVYSRMSELQRLG